MNVYLTFDVEVWCNDWNRLDERFPSSFERYVYGRSRHGDYALPATLDILERHGLKGVFFVEPLFSERFGREHLETIVRMIGSRGHSVQLHLHPEWVDEMPRPPFAGINGKRQHLIYYTANEQAILVGLGKQLLQQAGAQDVHAFRAGSFAANANTLRALSLNDIPIDSSFNECFDHSGADLRDTHPWACLARRAVGDVITYPVTVFRDGLGRLRPAQVTACSVAEFAAALDSAWQYGLSDFVIVSHNFEMLKPHSPEPDTIAVRRFEGLCRLLAENAERWRVTTDFAADADDAACARQVRSHAPLAATLIRYAEQAARRLL